MAEDTAVGFATNCKRPDFSPVWAGIPLAKMEYLKEGRTVFEEHYSLSQKDVHYLQNIIKHYPIDEFLDHAYYFLHDFEKVVGTDSIIGDVALLAAIQREDRRVGRNNWDFGKEFEEPFSKRFFLLKKFVDEYPHSSRYGAVRSDLISTLLVSGFLSEGLEVAFQDRDGVRRHVRDIVRGFAPSINRFGLDETLRVAKKYDFQAILLSHVHDDDLDEHVESAEHADADWPIVSEEHWYLSRNFDDIWGFLEGFDLRTALESFKSSGLIYTIGPKIDILWERYLEGRGVEILLSGDVRGALSEYIDQKSVMEEFGFAVPERLSENIDFLEGVAGAEAQNSDEIHLVGAIALRDFGATSVAVQRFESIASTSHDAVVAQKALYLAGATLRRMEQYRSAKDMFERLWLEFPSGHLADDALRNWAGTIW